MTKLVGGHAALMLQGTGSPVGKALLVAGLCRASLRRAFRDHRRQVRPFKPQNMSNNAAVTVDGGEIGRAQALPARAWGVAASVDMNPVLLKPQSQIGRGGRAGARARAMARSRRNLRRAGIEYIVSMDAPAR